MRDSHDLRIFVLAIVFAAAPAVAGPPEFSHLQFEKLAVTEAGVWAIGVDSCDEAGSRPLAVRLGADEMTVDAHRIATLEKGAVGGAAWHSGKDIYQPGAKPRVSHDGGKTWTAMDGIGKYVESVVGTAPDAVWGLAYSQLVSTSDRGKTWEHAYALVAPRKCY